MITVNIHEAKAQLSQLIDRMLRGETVRIARRNIPLAELKPLKPVAGRRPPPGFYKGQFTVPDSFFDPLPADELALWEGAGLDAHIRNTPLDPDFKDSDSR